jgi:hypothetical protein
MPAILATQVVEIRRIVVRSHPRQIVCKTLSWKNPSQKRAGKVVQGVGPGFKSQYCKIIIIIIIMCEYKAPKLYWVFHIY